MRKITGKVLQKLYLEDAAKGLFHVLFHFLRRLTFIDKRIVANYCRDHAVRKLHLGCGKNILKGWLNSDFALLSPRILYLNATRSFPLESNSFTHVFSEHMIEHITYFQGQDMLSECYRILGNNGKIRISTPNLSFLLDLHYEEKTSLPGEYIKWTIDTIVKDAPAYHASFVINNFMRDWGHVFIYDAVTLRESLERAGFRNIVQCGLNESDDPELRNLENEQRMPEGFLRLETMTFEATKITAD